MMAEVASPKLVTFGLLLHTQQLIRDGQEADFAPLRDGCA